MRAGIVLSCIILFLLCSVPADGWRGAQGVPTRPDVVILLTDQQRGDAFGAAGNSSIATPSMDRLAREGFVFTNAFCATPQCSPSRAALLTGRYPHRTGVMGNVELRSSAGLSAPLSPEIAGLAKILSGAGYETAYFGKWHLGGNPSEHGFQSSMPDSGTPLEGTLKFLENRKGSQAGRRPLLLFVSWLSPHQIYAVNDSRATDVAGDSASLATIPLPANLRDNLQGKPFPQVHFLKEDQGKPFQNYRPEDWRRYISFYNRLVAQVDREIGQVVRAVREESANSLIFFSSDHGDLGGAHGLPFKGPAMYEELVRVPLLFSWPGRLKPGVTRELVSNIDVLPTICELLSLPVPDGVDGISLASILLGRNRELRRDALFGEYYGKQNWRVPIRMVRTRDWKYVRYVKYGEELYDLQSDPGELRNLAAAPTAAGRRKELSSRLDRWIAQTKDPFPQLTVTDRSGRVLQ